jgi:hypothetical protein
LFEIASAVGTPLALDNSTMTRRIFNLDVVYERLLDFCSHCQLIGHNISVCKWLHPQRNDKKEVHGRKVKTDVINKIIKKEYILIVHQNSS